MSSEQVTRPAAVAGQFYSDDPRTLRNEVDRLLARAGPPPATAPKAVIAPHAGFMFSGATAARAYVRLAPCTARIQRIVLLGPSHFVPFQGLAVPSARRFATPLGDLALDHAGVEQALADPEVHTFDRAHAREHSLETQLPFILRALGSVSIVPIVVGEASGEAVARVLEALWGGPETAIVISSDLSHFHPDAEARELDAATAQTIEALQAGRIGPDNACGFLPVAGLLHSAAHRSASVSTLELTTSADAGAPPHSVVGYGAFELREAAA